MRFHLANRTECQCRWVRRLARVRSAWAQLRPL
jgi:hypothetical protein